jgi:hypothetical protein
MKKIIHLCWLILVVVGVTACGGGSDKHKVTYFSTSSNTSSSVSSAANSTSSVSSSAESSTSVDSSNFSESSSSVESSSSLESSNSSSVESSSSSSISARQISVTTLWPRNDENSEDFGHSSSPAYVPDANVFYSTYTIDEIGTVIEVEPYQSSENAYVNDGWQFEYPNEPSFLHVVTATRNNTLLPAVGENIFDAKFKLVVAPLIGNDIVLSPFSSAVLHTLLTTISPLAPTPQNANDYSASVQFLTNKLLESHTGDVLASHIDVARMVFIQTRSAQNVLEDLDAKELPVSDSAWSGFGLIDTPHQSQSNAYIITPELDKLLVLNHSITGGTPTPNHTSGNKFVYLGDGVWGEQLPIRQLTQEPSEAFPTFKTHTGQIFSMSDVLSKDVSNVNILKFTHALPFTPINWFSSKNGELVFSTGAGAAIATLTTLSDGHELTYMPPSDFFCTRQPYALDVNETNCARVPTLHYSKATQTFEPGFVKSLDEITYSEEALDTEEAALVMLRDWGGEYTNLYAQFIDNGTDKILRLYRFDSEADGSQFTHVRDARWEKATVGGLNGGAPTTVYNVDRLSHFGIFFWGHDIFFTMDEGYLRQGHLAKANSYPVLLLNPIALDDWIRFAKSVPSFMVSNYYRINGTEYRFRVGDYGDRHIEESMWSSFDSGCTVETSKISLYSYIATVQDDNSVNYHINAHPTYTEPACDQLLQYGRVIITPSKNGDITLTTSTGSFTGVRLPH